MFYYIFGKKFIIMKTKLLFLFLIVFQLSNAQQRTCGMETYMETLKSNPELKKQYDS